MKLTGRVKPAIDTAAKRFEFPQHGQTIGMVNPIIRTGASIALHELYMSLAGRKTISASELYRWIREQEEALR